MRLNLNKSNSAKLKSRKTKKVKIRKKLKGTTERPRLCVFKSLKNIYAQIVDDTTGKTILSVSTLGDVKDKTGREAATEVGKLIANKAKEKKIEKVVFDRSGYLYHGRVKAVADGAREAGLSF